ncbi:S-adenosyl-L-methionine-dependent methyltransferase [Gymnopilus junonius]|uniref:type I protein arginine methyltransferase n=1 Tax=Gymnopilus junonius TaxID=109634 RepID=A0A9P5TH70_GYMJU|nr:S-adenosyl-L-methionine-dependent methyltransferase [Gymnopilus junonius]
MTRKPLRPNYGTSPSPMRVVTCCNSYGHERGFAADISDKIRWRLGKGHFTWRCHFERSSCIAFLIGVHILGSTTSVQHQHHEHPSTPPASVSDDRNDSESGSSLDSEDDNDQTWDDWVSDSNAELETKSLFDEQVLQSVERALTYDKEIHHFDLNNFAKQSLAMNQPSIFIAAYALSITSEKINHHEEVLELEGTEPWFTSDEYLCLFWRAIIHSLIFSSEVRNASDSSVADKNIAAPTRDDDTHYFESYGANDPHKDIHAVMIQDKVRTSTYAQFILTNPTLFRDAVVLDVGCGTGILSLFAARAGAKHVIAVDASDIADKAAKIVKVNGFEDVITVVRGKIENISLPEGIDKVDIIISEWMGYALLYESMLDSVLRARDRFLKPAGVMAPSQCRMILGLCDATEIFKDRIGFWDDVYGFDMSAMAKDLYGESVVDVVGPETFLSKPFAIKDLVLIDITTAELDFSSSFSLISTADRRTKINSFLLYFDTFFTAHGGPVLPNTEVKTVKEGEAILAELWPVGGKSALQRRQSLGREKEHVTSFSTGPQSTPTHWKQTIFMLRDPITVSEGSIVTGTFMCKKSETNSRELDVEIHYSVKLDEESAASETIVQMYTVR